MKTYTISASDCNIEVWFDRSIRLWTAVIVDNDGYQMADAAYNVTKAGAIEDVKIHDIWPHKVLDS